MQPLKALRSYLKHSPGRTACLVAAAAYTIFFFVLQVRLHKGVHMELYDLALFDQSMYNSLQGRFLETTLRYPEGGSLFAEHFYLIMVVVLPLYALFRHTYLLFFLQALAGGAGAILIFFLAKDILGSEFAATCLAISYLLHPSVQGATLNLLAYGFHPDNFFPPLFLSGFYFLRARKWGWCAFFLLLALAVQETYALLLMALGLYLYIREHERRVGTIIVLVSTVWFVVATWVIVPYFLRGTAPWYFAAIDRMGDLLRNPLTLYPDLPRYFLVFLLHSYSCLCLAQPS